MSWGKMSKDQCIPELLVGISNHSPRHSTKRDYAFLESKSSLSLLPIRHQRIRFKTNNLQRELRMIKHPTFDGDHKNGEDVNSWLLRMRKNLQIYNYSFNSKAIITIYHLQGKALTWWDQLRQVNHLVERGYFGGSSWGISQRSICLSTTMTKDASFLWTQFWDHDIGGVWKKIPWTIEVCKCH